MEFKGTKGPWFLSNNDVSGKTEKPIIRGEGRMVCMLPPISPDNEANAKIIAAAPELLESLEYYFSVLREVRGETWAEKPDHVLQKMLDAYKKATE